MIRQHLLLIITGLCLFVFGCSTADRQQHMLNKNWGRSFETARQTQIIDTDAGHNQTPVTGLNGETAVVNLEKYTRGDSAAENTSAPDFRIKLSTE